jgi:uncharacterized protein
MVKLLFTLAVVVLGLMLWFGKGRSRGRSPSSAAPRAPEPAAPQAMLSCVRCGLHLPQSDALLDDSGRAYCGAEHRRLGPGHGPAR